MDKELKRNFIIANIVWILYGLAMMGIIITFDYVLIYSRLVTYITRLLIELLIVFLSMGIGFIGYYSKIANGYFIKEGLI